MGHQGMKSSLVIARPDRRQRRADHARPLLRRAGRPRRLRQVAARHDDGDAAAERAAACSCTAARSCPAASRAATSPWWTCSRRSAATRPATCRTPNCTSWNASPAPSAGACGGQFTANTMAMRLRGDRPGAAPARPARRRPTRTATAGRSSPARAVMALLDSTAAPARHLHARGVRERRRGGGRHRRLDQRRPASAGDGARGRHPLHHGRRGRDHAPHAVHRRPQARRQIRGARRAQDRRHPGAAEGAARRRPAARRLHDRHRQDAGREPEGRGVPAPTRT